MDKAAKTRQRILEKASTSSVSGSSDYSAASPEAFFEEIKAEANISDGMVTIQSQESDNTFEDMAALSPEMVEECLQELSKSSSPFSDFDDDKLFGLDRNAFDTSSAVQDPTWAWLYD